MADEAPDLDDGELYLPSDIFPDEIFHRPDGNSLRSELAPVDGRGHELGLAHRLAALALLDDRRLPAFSPPTNFEFRRAVRVGAVCLPPGPGLQRAGFGYGHACLGEPEFRAGGGPLFEYHYPHLAKPLQLQTENIQQARARVLQRQLNPGQCQIWPVHAGEVARGEYGGTGVFLPRVINAESKRKPGSGAKHTEQRQQPMRNVAVARQRMQLPHPSQRALPQDWTY